MDEARIDVSRASSFVDILVKITIILSFCLFLLSFYIYRFKAGAFYQRQTIVCDVVLSQGITDNSRNTNYIQQLFLEAKSDCLARAVRTMDLWGKIAFISIDITVLLPIIYFGGKKLVKQTTQKLIKKESLMQSN
jgi:hypothetical protein